MPVSNEEILPYQARNGPEHIIANQPDTLQKMDQILCWLVGRYSHFFPKD
jgi:hypothetical protein